MRTLNNNKRCRAHHTVLQTVTFSSLTFGVSFLKLVLCIILFYLLPHWLCFFSKTRIPDCAEQSYFYLPEYFPNYVLFPKLRFVHTSVDRTASHVHVLPLFWKTISLRYGRSLFLIFQPLLLSFHYFPNGIDISFGLWTTYLLVTLVPPEPSEVIWMFTNPNVYRIHLEPPDRTLRREHVTSQVRCGYSVLPCVLITVRIITQALSISHPLRLFVVTLLFLLVHSYRTITSPVDPLLDSTI